MTVVLIASIGLAVCALGIGLAGQIANEAFGLPLSSGLGGSPYAKTDGATPLWVGIALAASATALLVAFRQSTLFAVPFGVGLGVALAGFGSFAQKNEVDARSWEASGGYGARPDPLRMLAGLNAYGLVWLEMFLAATFLVLAVVIIARWRPSAAQRLGAPNRS